MIKKVGVIGSGQMGNGIAHVSALAGFDVVLSDVSPERLKSGMATINGNLARQVAKQVITEEAKNQALGRITLADQMDGLVRGDTNEYYREFVRAMRDIGYEGYMSYELCHPLPVVDGQTVDIGYAHRNAQLAAEFMRELIESEAAPAGAASAQAVARR